MQTVPQLLRNIRKRAPTPEEACHLDLLDLFVAELVRLARCAVEKACGPSKLVQT